MVSFEEMIKSLELRDVLIKFLTRSHKSIKKSTGFDMDQMQLLVLENFPKFDGSNALDALAFSIIFWTSLFFTLHNMVISPMMKSKGYTEYFRSAPLFKMSPKQKMYYSSYFLGILHSVIAFLGAVYCFIYADGEKETTLFHCNWYKINMFDIQKFFNVFTIGYLLI